MVKEYKITFKKGKRATGLAAVTDGTPNTDIKYKNKSFGYITHNNRWCDKRNGIEVWFKKKKDNKMGWVWAKLIGEFKNEDEARERLQSIKDKIIAMAYFDEGDE